MNIDPINMIIMVLNSLRLTRRCACMNKKALTLFSYISTNVYSMILADEY